MPDHITQLIDSFTPFSIVLRLVLATLFGGIIGIEREYKRHSAGFRTFTLVCLGSALATIVNIYLFNITGSADVSRIPAAVVSGIGFLGVGTIIVTRKNTVKGLTTAAGLWTTACLGIALGAGMIWTSIISFALIMILISLLSKISRYISVHNKLIILYIEVKNESDLELLHKWLEDKGYNLVSMDKKKEKGLKESEFSATVEVDLGNRTEHRDLIRDISKLKWIQYVEEIGT